MAAAMKTVWGLMAALAILMLAPTAGEAGHRSRHHPHGHYHGPKSHVHKFARHHRVVRRPLTPRQRTFAWHCNPWHGPSRLEGPLFTLGKGAYRGRCYAHQTYVARDYRRWQWHKRWHRHVTHHRHAWHGRHEWLRNADLPYRVR